MIKQQALLSVCLLVAAWVRYGQPGDVAGKRAWLVLESPSADCVDVPTVPHGGGDVSVCVFESSKGEARANRMLSQHALLGHMS